MIIKKTEKCALSRFGVVLLPLYRPTWRPLGDVRVLAFDLLRDSCLSSVICCYKKWLRKVGAALEDGNFVYVKCQATLSSKKTKPAGKILTPSSKEALNW